MKMRGLYMGWLDKFFGRNKASISDAADTQPAASPVTPFTPTPTASNDDPDDYGPLENVGDYIRRDYWGGFYSDEEILENARDVMLDEMEESSMDEREMDTLLLAALTEVKAAHAQEQKNWPDKTDCDRLDEAFTALEASGIVARQNFTCCGSCGSAEIWGEIETVQNEGGNVRGYAFYHAQDTESAVDGYGLYLGYGATEEGEAAALKIAHNIVAGLESHGLQTHWDGTWNQRIGVTLDWKKRR